MGKTTKDKKKDEEIEASKKTEQKEEAKTEKADDIKVEIKDAQPEKDDRDEQIAKLGEQLMRNMAEYDNYRKRTAKEKLELEPVITARVVGEIFPVIDNIERALKTDCTDESYKKGIEMIYESFVDVLRKLGVEEIETDGADFNPAYHQAVQQVQSDELESGKIATTFQKGYKIGEKILRFSMVAVVS